MAFSNIAGFEVTPRSDSSRSRRSSSPLVMRLRRIWSSHTLVPAAVSAASLSLSPAPTLIRKLLSGASGYSLHHGSCPLRDLLRRESEVLVERGLRGRGPEGRHPDRLAVVPDPGAPAERGGRLHRNARAHVGRQHAVPVVLVLLGEAVEARSGDHAGSDAVLLEQLRGAHADVHLGAGPDQDQVRLAVRRVPQDVRAAV